MGTNRPNRKRTLMVEHLDRRELLAAGVTCLTGLPLDAPQEGRAVIVQAQHSSVIGNCVETSLNQRERTEATNNTDTGRLTRTRVRSAADVIATSPAGPPTGDPDACINAAGQTDGQVVPGDDLSEDEIADLLFVREEEKLARDVYLALDEMWDDPVFANIAQAEQKHMDAIGRLIEKYDLEDPVATDVPGVFKNATLQQLYDDLVSNNDGVNLEYLGLDLVIDGGATSELAAYQVGAFIEEFDIIDIEHTIAQTSHDDIENVYENLLRGSRNHLRSFVERIEATTGEAYEPVVMVDSDPITGEDLDDLYQEIISGDRETANGQSSDRKRGSHAGQNSPTASSSTVTNTDQFFNEYGQRSRGGSRGR